MKPIEAEVHVVENKLDEHGEVVLDKDEAVVTENVVVQGVLVDVIVLADKADDKESQDAYALFFEEKGDMLTPSIEQLKDIRVRSPKMRNYINSFYAK